MYSYWNKYTFDRTMLFHVLCKIKKTTTKNNNNFFVPTTVIACVSQLNIDFDSWLNTFPTMSMNSLKVDFLLITGFTIWGTVKRWTFSQSEYLPYPLFCGFSLFTTCIEFSEASPLQKVSSLFCPSCQKVLYLEYLLEISLLLRFFSACIVF